MPRKKKDMVEETGHMDPVAFIKAVKEFKPLLIFQSQNIDLWSLCFPHA